MDEIEKNQIVKAYFAAAEAKMTLEELAPSESRNKVVPISLSGSQDKEANVSFFDMASTWDAAPTGIKKYESKILTSNQVKSIKTGAYAMSKTIRPIQPGYLKVGTKAEGGEQSSALVYWEDLEKHQWMLDVLAELEVYASANSLADTAEALVAARCEIISLAARTR